MPIQKADFYKTWSRIITRAISLCYKEMDDDFVEKTKVSLMDSEVYAENLYGVVKRKERWLREEYLPKHKPNKDKSSLDVHKISSIFCRSIIGCKPFSYDMSMAKKELERIHKEENISQPEKIKWEIDNIYVNYKLAFMVSEGMAFEDLIFWAGQRIRECEEQSDIHKDDPNVKSYLDDMKKVYMIFRAQLIKETDLCLYVKSDNHDTFCDSIEIALMKNDWLMRDFDYLAYATILFQWQEYTKMKLFYKILLSGNYKIEITNVEHLFKGPKRLLDSD